MIKKNKQSKLNMAYIALDMNKGITCNICNEEAIYIIFPNAYSLSLCPKCNYSIYAGLKCYYEYRKDLIVNPSKNLDALCLENVVVKTTIEN